MSEPRDDQDFADYLDGKSQVSREYAGLGSEGPPPELDAKIRAEAERTLKVSELQGRTPPRFKAFAWAAIVVLSCSLVLNIVFEELPPVARDEAFLADIEELQESKIQADDPAAARPLPGPAAAPSMAMRQSVRAPEERVSANDLKSESLLEKRSASEGDDSQIFEILSEAASESTAFRVEHRLADSVDDGSLRRLRDPERTEQVMSRIMAYLDSSPAKAGTDGRASGAVSEQTPDEVLQEVLRLYRDGDNIAAEQALDAFRERYPDHPVVRQLTDEGF